MGKKKAAWHLVPGAEDLKTEQKLEAIREEEKEEKKEEPKREGFTITFLDKSNKAPWQIRPPSTVLERFCPQEVEVNFTQKPLGFKFAGGLLRHRFRASTLELPFRLGGESSRVAALRVVRFNGQEGDFNDYKTVMGFVPQEIGCMDQFGCWAVKMWCMKDLQQGSESEVVGEQIRFSADLRNAYDTDAPRLVRFGVFFPLIAEDVLKVMQLDGLQNRTLRRAESFLRETRGKRVSIGLELAADPTMLFLDEPTSGLDAASSLAIVQSLKRMSQLGMTSVLVVHQPRFSLFSLFDDVLLLGKGGRTVYFGPPKSAKLCPFGLGFVMPKSENPADWFMDLISGEVPNQKIPHFVPEMLFDIWELNKDRVQRKARA
ncbi:unnamed protein product [Durusdinium trenchii]|uniref:ABC transporter domain-containing protein n=1 Tax=Durusdinium trenchii TaxID=1381693 RepID=A0ABP0IX65_9DINO